MPRPNVQADLAEAARRVRDDREHGASWLARQAADALAAYASAQPDSADPESLLRHLHAAAQAFAAARPSMAALANTAARIWSAGAPPASLLTTSSMPGAERLRAIRDEAGQLIALWQEASVRILDFSRPLLAGTLYTLSRSGTVEQVLVTLAGESGDGPQIIVAESRPGGEGIASARALVAAGWRVTLVPDTACALFMPQASAVVVGADSVRADGGVVNKVGTYPLALAAQAHRVPVYVLCETMKIAAPDFPLVLEEMSPAELLPDPPAGVTVRNPYFDHTPAALVTHIVTERGILSPAELTRIAGEAAHNLALLHAS
jgi:ribose 1,5-bisphosphate isomerase